MPATIIENIKKLVIEIFKIDDLLKFSIAIVSRAIFIKFNKSIAEIKINKVFFTLPPNI